MKTNEPITFTQENYLRYRKVWGGMPYAGSICVSYEINPEAMLGNLERLKETLEHFAKRNEEMEASFGTYRDAVSSLGTLLKLAAKEAKDV